MKKGKSILGFPLAYVQIKQNIFLSLFPSIIRNDFISVKLLYTWKNIITLVILIEYVEVIRVRFVLTNTFDFVLQITVVDREIRSIESGRRPAASSNVLGW